MDILQVFGQTLQVSENPESMIVYRPELKYGGLIVTISFVTETMNGTAVIADHPTRANFGSSNIH